MAHRYTLSAWGFVLGVLIAALLAAGMVLALRP